MAQTIADLMAETLRAAGVKRIYGVAGDSLNGFTDSLRRQKTIERHSELDERAARFLTLIQAAAVDMDRMIENVSTIGRSG